MTGGMGSVCAWAMPARTKSVNMVTMVRFMTCPFLNRLGMQAHEEDDAPTCLDGPFSRISGPFVCIELSFSPEFLMITDESMQGTVGNQHPCDKNADGNGLTVGNDGKDARDHAGKVTGAVVSSRRD